DLYGVKRLCMKQLLSFALLACITYASSAQNWLNKLNKKLDSLNTKSTAFKRKSDSTRATTAALTGAHTATNTPAAGGTSYANGTPPPPPPPPPAPPPPASTSNTANTNTGDDLVFTLTGCSGSIGGQTVTLSFTIANPNKVNQTINIGWGAACKAIDQDGDVCRPKECVIANGNGAGYTEVPTGLTLQGSITFANLLSKEQQLALVQFNIFTRNSDGGRDPHTKSIDMRNIPISWQ